MPELDDEFAKDVSEFDTLEELKADLRKKEEESREASAKQAFENNLMELVAENMECDIPEAMVENQARRVVDDYKMQVQSQGMRFADYLQMTGMKEADLLDSAKEPALRQLRGSLALEAIIKAEGIEAFGRCGRADQAREGAQARGGQRQRESCRIKVQRSVE